MLFSILKSFQKRNKTTQIEPEIELSLSFIESGCMAALIDGRTAFILKGSQSEIELLKYVGQILFGFECIKRSEFPSVRMHFELKGRTNKPYQFDYLFGIESDEDMELLSRLKDQDSFDIIFFDSAIRYSKRFSISQEEKKKIKSVVDEASRGN